MMALLALISMPLLAAQQGEEPSNPEPITCDVLVYGGTSAGITAAIAAAGEGLEVCLIEPSRHVGGAISGGLCRTDHGRKGVIGGLSREFFERLGTHYGEPITWYPEPHVAEDVFLDWLREAGVRVVYEKRIDTVQKQSGHLQALTTLDGTRFTADLFIDASYEGDLLPRAGISYTWGREGQDVYGESLAGRREYSKYHQFSVPVSPYDGNGELLPFVYGGDPGEPGEGDQKVQAYNFRLCMTKDKDNMVPFPRPEGYEPGRYELLRRYLAAKPGLTVPELMNPVFTKNGKTDTNNNGPFSTDYIGGSWDYPEAGYEEREEIWEEHKRYVQGFLFFLANDPSVPPALHAEMNTWGLAKDEFTDNGNWPYQLYIREARRMLGEYVVRQADLQTDRSKPDSIGMGSYNSDSHHVQRIPAEDGAVINEGDMQVPVLPYEIPYRAILPKREECENLLVPVCVSASHVAYSSMRMEPQYMIMGHAAGIAAAFALEEDVPVQEINVEALRTKLREQRQILSLVDTDPALIAPEKLPGVVVDNVHATAVGDWRSSVSNRPFVGFDYLHDNNEDKGDKRVRFTPDLPKAGVYEVRLAYSPGSNRATNVPVHIRTAAGDEVRTVNQRDEPDTATYFVTLGTFRFEAGRKGWVEIRTEGTGGHVIADAVQWLPAE